MRVRLATAGLLACAACRIDTPPHREGGALMGGEGYRSCQSATRDPAGGFCDVGTLASVGFRTAPGGMPAVTVADFDGDGRPDVFATDDHGDSPALLLNRWPRFEDATVSAGLAALRETRASAAADLDDDGDEDLAVSLFRGPVRVYRNDGGVFSLAAELTPAGYDVPTVSFADLNADGRLELLLGNFRQEGSCSSPFHVSGCPSSVQVFTQTAPFAFVPVRVDAPPRRVLALRAVDWDGDGRDEVMVAADVGILDGGNLVLRVVPEDGGAGFSLRDATEGSGAGVAVLAMGLTAVDADGDGADELWVSNFGYPVLLQRGASDPGGAVVDRGRAWLAGAYGVALAGDAPVFTQWDESDPAQAAFAAFQRDYLDEGASEFPSTKWSALAWDFDQDGRQDLFVTAGYIGIISFPEPGAQSAVMMRANPQRAGFDDATTELGLRAALDSYNAAAADFDGDGDLDLALAHASPAGPERVHVLRNDVPGGAGLTVAARGRAGRDGIGARVEVTVAGRVQRRRVDGSGSIFGGGPHEAHFGLGGSAVADEVVVRFPSGAERRATNVPAGRLVVEE